VDGVATERKQKISTSCGRKGKPRKERSGTAAVRNQDAGKITASEREETRPAVSGGIILSRVLSGKRGLKKRRDQGTRRVVALADRIEKNGVEGFISGVWYSLSGGISDGAEPAVSGAAPRGQSGKRGKQSGVGTSFLYGVWDGLASGEPAEGRVDIPGDQGKVNGFSAMSSKVWSAQQRRRLEGNDRGKACFRIAKTKEDPSLEKRGESGPQQGSLYQRGEGKEIGGNSSSAPSRGGRIMPIS